MLILRQILYLLNLQMHSRAIPNSIASTVCSNAGRGMMRDFIAFLCEEIHQGRARQLSAEGSNALETERSTSHPRCRHDRCSVRPMCSSGQPIALSARSPKPTISRNHRVPAAAPSAMPSRPDTVDSTYRRCASGECIFAVLDARFRIGGLAHRP